MSAVSKIDVDSGFAEACRCTSQFPRTMSTGHFRSLSLGVVCLLAIENRFGHGRIVQDETYGALALLQRERLKRENVDALFGEGLAELAKRSRSIFQTDCELL